MQKSRIKKSVEKLEETLDELELFYTKAINKSTEFFSMLKNNLANFYTLEFKSLNSQNIKIRVLQANLKFWKIGQNQFTILDIDVLSYDHIKKQYIEAVNQYKDMRKKLKNINKQMRELNDLHSRIEEEINMYNDPIVYYNIQEKQKHKKAIADLFSRFCNQKQNFIKKMEEKSKVVSAFSILKENLVKKSSQGFLKFNYSLQKFREEIQITINQFYAALLQSLKKEIRRIDSNEFQFEFLTEKEEFKRQHLIILSKLKSLTKQQTESFYVKCWNFGRNLVKSNQQYIKANLVYEEYFTIMIQKIFALKRAIELELKQIFNIKVVKDPLYEQNYYFMRSYKGIINSIQSFCDLTILIQREHVTYINNLKELYDRKSTTVESLKRIINKSSTIDSKRLLQLYQTINQDLIILEQIQKEEDVKIKQFFKTITEKYYNEINQNKINLKSFQTKENFNQSDQLASSDHNSGNHMNHSQKTREMENMIKKKFSLEEQEIHIKEWDSKFQSMILKILQTNEINVQITQQDRRSEKEYSCALGGKLLLAGLLKIYKNKFSFESSFNKKNIFFGTTLIIIPKEEIVDIKKDSLMLLHNSIQIETRKGNLLFTSLFSRDQVFVELNAIINNENQNIQRREQQIEEVQPKTIVSELPDIQEINHINSKGISNDNDIFRRYPVQFFSLKLEKTNIKKYFREFWENQIKIKTKKYINFKVYYLDLTGNIEIKSTEWDPLPPRYYSKKSNNRFSDVQISSRQLTYRHQLPPLPIPFLPKYGNCTEKQKAYWISMEQFIIETENIMTGAPFSDSFVIFVKYIVKQQGEDLQIDATAQVRFVKSSMFQKVLREAAEKQMKIVSKNVKQQTINYLNILQQRKRNKRNPGINNNEQEEQEKPGLQNQKSIQKANEDQLSNDPEVLKDLIKNLQDKYNKHMIGLTIIFLITLIISHLLF